MCFFKVLKFKSSSRTALSLLCWDYAGIAVLYHYLIKDFYLAAAVLVVPSLFFFFGNT